jgi:hypothetical protein
MSNVPRSNPELEAALNNVNDASELRETLLAKLAEQGHIFRMRTDAFDNRLIRQPQTPDVSLPANGYAFEREVRFHPESGKRTLVLRANSQADLDALERQVTGQ